MTARLINFRQIRQYNLTRPHLVWKVKVDVKVECPQEQQLVLCHTLLQLPVGIADL